MIKHIQIKNSNDINAEFTAISRECERAFTAWIQDRSNKKLYFKYRDLLEQRENFIHKYKSYFIIH